NERIKKYFSLSESPMFADTFSQQETQYRIACTCFTFARRGIHRYQCKTNEPEDGEERGEEHLNYDKEFFLLMLECAVERRPHNGLFVVLVEAVPVRNGVVQKICA